ncbi:diguanylate cyclase [Azonexus sp.]|uniref:sensor domain-containing diguanylate cyclase n=1 Tax=Azonexus sp. TaxID=1872668 RepID=UPI0039E5FC67
MAQHDSISPALPLDAAQLRYLLDDVGACIYAKDRHGRYTFANRATLALWGQEDSGQIVGQTDHDFFEAETAANVAHNDREAIEFARTISREETNRVKGGAGARIFLSIKKPLFDQTGQVSGMYGVSTDITAFKQLEEELRQEKEQLRLVLDNMEATVYVKNRQRRYLYANQHIAVAYGKTVDEIVGQLETDLVGQELSDFFSQADRVVLEEGRKIALKESFLSPDGKQRHYWSIKMPIVFNGEPGLIGFSSDITELHDLQEELKNLANTDSLTGAANRRFFLVAAEQELLRSKTLLTPLSLALFDIDWFKKINDTWGHPVGDRVLKAVAQICQSQLRKQNLFARIGGEEFAILLPKTGLAEAQKIAERLRAAITTIHFEDIPEMGPISASFGLTACPDETPHFDALFARADKALYQAKAAGRNRVHSAE